MVRFGYVPGYHRGYHRLRRRLLGSRKFTRELEYRMIAPWFRGGHPMRVLDLACGSGDYCWPLAFQGHRVTGLDLRREGLEDAAQVRPYVPGVDFVRGDALALPFLAEAFDACLCNSSIEHFDDPAAAAREIRRVLRPGGLLVLTTDAFPPQLSRLWQWLPRGWRKPHLRTGDLTHRAREHHRTEHHVTTYFTPDHLRTLLAQSGFEVVVSRPYLAGWFPRRIFEAHVVLRWLEFYNATSQRVYPLVALTTHLDSRRGPGFGVFAVATTPPRPSLFTGGTSPRIHETPGRRPMSVPLSAIVLTKNEEHNLPDCLASLRWADEVVVVDSFSTDRTVAIAQDCGARVVQHPFHDYAAQHNVAQAQAQHDWVLFIDADERVSPELAREIRNLAETGALTRHTAYHIERLHLYSGRWLFSDPARRRLTPRYRDHLTRVEVPRLYDRRQAVWTRPLHEVVRVPGPHGVLSGVIYHYSSTNLSATFESFNDYTDREADYLYRTLGRQRVTVPEAVYRGIRSFAFFYFRMGWWRFGEQGQLAALFNGMSTFANYAKLGERLRIARNRGQWTARDRRLLRQFSPDPTLEDRT